MVLWSQTRVFDSLHQEYRCLKCNNYKTKTTSPAGISLVLGLCVAH